MKLKTQFYLFWGAVGLSYITVLIFFASAGNKIGFIDFIFIPFIISVVFAAPISLHLRFGFFDSLSFKKYLFIGLMACIIIPLLVFMGFSFRGTSNVFSVYEYIKEQEPQFLLTGIGYLLSGIFAIATSAFGGFMIYELFTGKDFDVDAPVKKEKKNNEEEIQEESKEVVDPFANVHFNSEYKSKSNDPFANVNFKSNYEDKSNNYPGNPLEK